MQLLYPSRVNFATIKYCSFARFLCEKTLDKARALCYYVLALQRQQVAARLKYFVEINLEKQPDYKALFKPNLDVKRIVPEMAAMYGTPIVAGQTLLFIDEIQECAEAIMALRYFKEDMPGLHVVAAGSLLEFVLEDIPTFGVGRIHSMYTLYQS